MAFGDKEEGGRLGVGGGLGKQKVCLNLGRDRSFRTKLFGGFLGPKWKMKYVNLRFSLAKEGVPDFRDFFLHSLLLTKLKMLTEVLSPWRNSIPPTRKLGKPVTHMKAEGVNPPPHIPKIASPPFFPAGEYFKICNSAEELLITVGGGGGGGGGGKGRGGTIYIL